MSELNTGTCYTSFNKNTDGKTQNYKSKAPAKPDDAKAQSALAWGDVRPALSKLGEASKGRALWQLANTLIPYAGIWYLMVRSLQLGYSYWWTLALAVPAAALLVRIFILFHDCVHGSFFRSPKANRIVGHVLGFLVFTSYEDWRFAHLKHHATHADLDNRGFGDIWTMTVQEYEQADKKTRLLYRLYRNPIVLVGFGALFNFLLRNRVATKRAQRKQWLDVMMVNLGLVALLTLAAMTIGLKAYILVQLPIIWMAGIGGVWLFYVQHQFEGGYWARKSEWNPLRAAMEGSSFYKLPAILNWCSANIGYHHIHHLNPRIPNYRLQDCYSSVPAMQSAPVLTLLQSLSCFRLKLWDEQGKRMTGFRQ